MKKLGFETKGFAFIELILVLVVIALLSGWYFREGSSPHEQAAGQYKQSMDRSKSTACLASRSALRTTIQMHTMQNPSAPVTKESLAAANINVNVCPEQGQITVATDGTLACSVHP